MKIASFDVGIKTLAYCIMSYDNGEYIITDWNIINIFENLHPYMHWKCNNQKCNFKIKYLHDNEMHGLCRKHFSLHHSKECYDIIKLPKATKIPLQILSQEIIRELDNIPELLTVDKIVIENQPVLKIPTMKSIQMIIFTYFQIRGIYTNKIKSVNLFSPRRKLDIYQGPEVECNIINKYKKRKYLSVEYCKWILRFNPEYLVILDCCGTKKDDYCDAFMQGALFLSKQ